MKGGACYRIRSRRPPNFPENQLGASLKAGGSDAPVPLPENFPENQLGASLKEPVVDRGSDQTGHFPENQLGASLKGIAFQGGCR